MSQPGLVATCIVVSAVTAAVTVWGLSKVRTLKALDPRSAAVITPPA